MVDKSPKQRQVGFVSLPSGLNCLQMGAILTTYKSWDDPPSMVGVWFEDYECLFGELSDEEAWYE